MHTTSCSKKVNSAKLSWLTEKARFLAASKACKAILTCSRLNWRHLGSPEIWDGDNCLGLNGVPVGHCGGAGPLGSVGFCWCWWFVLSWGHTASELDLWVRLGSAGVGDLSSDGDILLQSWTFGFGWVLLVLVICPLMGTYCFRAGPLGSVGFCWCWWFVLWWGHTASELDLWVRLGSAGVGDLSSHGDILLQSWTFGFGWVLLVLVICPLMGTYCFRAGPLGSVGFCWCWWFVLWWGHTASELDLWVRLGSAGVGDLSSHGDILLQSWTFGFGWVLLVLVICPLMGTYCFRAGATISPIFVTWLMQGKTVPSKIFQYREFHLRFSHFPATLPAKYFDT